MNFRFSIFDFHPRRAATARPPMVRAAAKPKISVRASVLVIVLVTLLFAAFALVTFVEKASNDLLVEAREAAGHRLRQEAYSTLEVTLAVLENFRQADGGLRSPSEGWDDPLGFAGWTPRDGCTAEVTFEDESGKLSLPHVDAATLVNLFVTWDLSQTDAEKLADSLLSWMRNDYVPATTRLTDYESAALPYDAPLRSLRSYSELAAIDFARDVFYDENGRPNDRWHRFVAALSLFDFKQTNLNGGQPDVFSALGSLDENQQRQLGEYLTGTGSRAKLGPAFFQNTADAASLIGVPTLPGGYGTTISALRINITIREGRTTFRLSAVVAPQGGATTVQTTAVSASLAAPANGPTAGNPVTPPASSPATTPPPPELNYPFTLLEIRENAEIPPVPPPPPTQPPA